MNAPFPGGDPDTYTDYVQHALPTVEEQLTRLRAEYDSLAGKYVAVQPQLVAMEQRHDRLFTAFKALSEDPELSQYMREQIAAVLVDHLKGWKS